MSIPVDRYDYTTHTFDGGTKDDGGEDEEGAPMRKAWAAGGITFNGIGHLFFSDYTFRCRERSIVLVLPKRTEI